MIYYPIVALLVAVGLALLVTRVATVALMLTGLSKDSARFQSRSAFSGSGFTTAEAESVVSHPVRRRIVSFLMLLGNVGLVAVVASLVLSFIQQPAGSHKWVAAYLLGGLAILWIIAASGWVDRQMSKVIEWALQKWTDLNVRDYESLLHVSAGYGVAEAPVASGTFMVGQTLAQLKLRQQGVLVLSIRRENGGFEGAPKADTRIEAGDTLVVYGRGPDISSVCGVRTS